MMDEEDVREASRSIFLRLVLEGALTADSSATELVSTDAARGGAF